MTQKRLSKDNYIWHIAFAAAKRGTCDRFRGGCVIAREGVIIATGYNGSAPGEKHCSDVGHDMVAFVPSDRDLHDESIESHCVRTIHAEINAIISAAYLGTSIKGCDWYITGVPCKRCSRAIARLEPTKLFLCESQGGLDDDRKAIHQWWKMRQHITGVKIVIKSLHELELLGVVT